MKRILITGGTGFIGSHLAEKLIAEGYEITILALRNIVEDIEAENLKLLKNLGVKIVFGDLRHIKTLEKAVEGNDVVIHLAVISRPMNIPRHLYYDINEKGTINLIKICNEYKIKKVVHVSSVSVLGLSPDGIPLKEDNYQSLVGDDYGLSKLKGEQAAIKLATKYKIPFTVIRPALVYGPRCIVRNIIFKFVQKRLFPLFGDGEAKMEFCYVENLVSALISAMRPKYNGEIFNITDGNPYKISEVLNVIADNLKVNRPSINLPVWLGKFIGLTTEVFFKMLGKSPPFFKNGS